MMKNLRVLLVSPLDPKVPGNLKFLMGGENTYTMTLLENPPEGVEHVHFMEALRLGLIDYSKWHKPFNFLMKARIIPPDAGIQCFKILGDFDLIHCHGYGLKVENFSGPIVLSDSSSNLLFLRDYLGWSRARIEVGYFIKKFLVSALNIYDLNFNLMGAPLVVWSRFAKKVHIELGCDPKKIVVIAPGIEKLRGKKIDQGAFKILFVGVWFERKGGEVVLKAFELLKKRYPSIKLTVIGQLPRNLVLPEGILHKDYVPRERLIKEVFSPADVLVLVPELAEGYGLVVLEAASLGIPAVVTAVYALPELVKDGKTGFVIKPGNALALAEALAKLIKNRQLLRRMGKEAKARFLQRFYLEVTNKKLLETYHEALKR
jgi:glycosyltransferase involved in cell wall biosynthesis